MTYGRLLGVWELADWRVLFAADDVGYGGVPLSVTQAAESLCSPSHVPIRTLHLFLPNLVQTFLQPAEPRLARSMRNFWEPPRLYGLYKVPCVPEALWEDDALHSAPKLPSKPLHLHRAIQAPLHLTMSVQWKPEAFPNSWVWVSLLQTSPSVKRQQSLLYPTGTKGTSTIRQARKSGWDSDAECVSCSNSPSTRLYATFWVLNWFGSSYPKTCLEQNMSVLARSWLQISV